MIDKEWEDGDDSELENEAYSAGFSEGYAEGYDTGYKQAIVDMQNSEKRLEAMSKDA